MNIAEYKGVFVFAQQVDNELSGIGFELIGKGKELAQELGTEVTAVLVGSDVKGLADELAAYRIYDDNLYCRNTKYTRLSSRSSINRRRNTRTNTFSYHRTYGYAVSYNMHISHAYKFFQGF